MKGAVESKDHYTLKSSHLIQESIGIETGLEDLPYVMHLHITVPLSSLKQSIQEHVK